MNCHLQVNLQETNQICYIKINNRIVSLHFCQIRKPTSEKCYFIRRKIAFLSCFTLKIINSRNHMLNFEYYIFFTSVTKSIQ
jgi:hypothetical protein